MSKRRKNGRPVARTRFKVGDRVRVKQGVMDGDYPDMPLGGWAGTICKLHSGGLVSLRWSRQTLASIHPIFKRRCRNDGMVHEEYCLRHDELEPDRGGPLSIEKPKTVAPRPLSAKNPADRVRMVFALSGDDLVPRPLADALATYRDYLVTELSLPFEAKYQTDTFFFEQSSVRIVNVVALTDDLDLDEGILCEVRTSRGDDVLPLAHLHPRCSDPNRQLVDDFREWFVGELAVGYMGDDDEDDAADDFDCFDEYDDQEEEHDEGCDYGEDDDEVDDADDDDVDEDDTDECDADEPDAEEELKDDADEVDRQTLVESRWRNCVDVSALIFQTVVVVAAYGAVTGAVLLAVPWARWAASIAGGLFCAAFVVYQAKSFAEELSGISSRFMKLVAVTVGLTTNVVSGAFLGIAVAAWMGALSGMLVGLLFHCFRGGAKPSALTTMPRVVWCSVVLGRAVEAFCRNTQLAARGIAYGGLVGLAGGLLVCCLRLLLVISSLRRAEALPVTS